MQVEAPFILHGWLRTVRADSGFFDGTFLDFLEARALPYVGVARLTTTLQRQCAGIKAWTVMVDKPPARRCERSELP